MDPVRFRAEDGGFTPLINANLFQKPPGVEFLQFKFFSARTAVYVTFNAFASQHPV